MPKQTEFFRDIKFFEKEFDGITFEIMIDTKNPKGVLNKAHFENESIGGAY